MTMNPFGIPPEIAKQLLPDVFERSKEFFGGKRRKDFYVRTFQTPTGKRVLEDLAHLAQMDRSVFNKDPIVMARDAGRQEMVFHILNILKLDITQLGDEFND